MMKQPNSLVKMATVLSSVLLVGGFVSYRAGAFGWLTETIARSDHPESSQTVEENLGDGPDSVNSSSESVPAPVFISSTKSQIMSGQFQSFPYGSSPPKKSPSVDSQQPIADSKQPR